ncbi:hypothetical protein PDESU_00370 [Pontiella desulfatans]|uniref:Uncharacterized protein n=1 Tax=Pontiella desulfatans TaxID=2750659 RepID=A0A6C2TW49_PONDE|nr:DUF4394 domain-containing protein [Pontiella desulfatans]VGO11823.1 hypothetical protein PDESU_00370 [Pontiella desulfatans]
MKLKVLGIVLLCVGCVLSVHAYDFQMYGIDSDADELVLINMTNGTTTTVAPLGVDLGVTVAFDYNPVDGLLYFVENKTDSLYSVSPTGGVASLVWSNALPGTESTFIASLGFSITGDAYVYAEGAAFEQGNLYSFDLSTGNSTLLGGANSYPSVLGGDLSSDGTMWLSDEWDGKVYRVSINDGAEVWSPSSAIWHTGNGPGDLHDMDEAYGGSLWVSATDRTSGSVNLIVELSPLSGLEISRVVVDRFGIHSIASVPYPDSDGDGLLDKDEVGIYGTDPNNRDMDGDGLSDGQEILIYNTDPKLADSDADGFGDLFEISTGFSPTSTNSTPDLLSEIQAAIEFQFNAATGVSYRIEATDDLANAWEVIETDIIGPGGEVKRLYSIEGQDKRYFRARRN